MIRFKINIAKFCYFVIIFILLVGCNTMTTKISSSSEESSTSYSMNIDKWASDQRKIDTKINSYLKEIKGIEEWREEFIKRYVKGNKSWDIAYKNGFFYYSTKKFDYDEYIRNRQELYEFLKNKTQTSSETNVILKEAEQLDELIIAVLIKLYENNQDNKGLNHDGVYARVLVDTSGYQQLNMYTSLRKSFFTEVESMYYRLYEQMEFLKH